MTANQNITGAKATVIVSSRLLLGFVFIYASFEKIIDPVIFSSTIDLYKATPTSINNLVALILPWIELLLGVSIILGIYLDGAIILTIILLIWFIFILSQALLRGINLDCGCFNLADKTNEIDLRIKMIYRIVQDLVFLALAFLIKYRDK